MKRSLATCAALLLAVAPARANLRDGGFDLPDTTPVVQEVSGGMRCLKTQFSPTFYTVELVREHATIAAATYMRGELVSVFESELLLKYCGP